MNGLELIDMIEHYIIKIKEIEFRMKDVLAHLDNCAEFIMDKWNGESANATTIRLDETRFELNKIQEALIDAKEKLECIREQFF